VKRPLVWVAIAFALGTGLTDVTNVPVVVLVPVVPTAVAIAALTASRRVGAAWALCAVLVAGALWSSARDLWDAGTLRRCIERPLTVEGQVVACSQGSSGTAQITVDAARIEHEPGRWTRARGRIRLRQRSAAEPSCRPGDLVRFRGVLRLPCPARNPGGFDERRYLAARGVRYVARAVGTGGVRVVRRGARRTRAALAALRDRFTSTAERALPPGHAALLRGLVLGDRSHIPQETADAFVDAGVCHVLAVSGLHVGYVAALAGAIVRGARLPPAPGVALCLFVLGSYTLLTGGRPSVVRAATMTGAALCAPAVGRRPDPLNLLGLAALALLVVSPGCLWDAGFHLSFAATAGILVAAPFLRRTAVLDRLPPALGNALAVGAAAHAATAPLVAYHFGRVSVVGVAANLVAVPVAGGAVLLGLAAMVVGCVWPALGVLVCRLDAPLLGCLLCLSRWAARIPFSAIDVGRPSSSVVLAIYVAAALVIGPPAGAPAATSRRRGMPAAALLLVANAVVWSSLAAGGPQLLRVVFLDVGQGDCAVLSLPGGGTVLVDAGGVDPGQAEAGGWEPGRDVVVPYLRSRGIRRIDVAVVSHGHADHAGGMPAVLRSFEVTELWLPRADRTDATADLERDAAATGTLVRRLGRGYRRRIGAGVLLAEVLGPTLAARLENVNDLSLVVRMSYGSISFLFPGDIEAEGERLLVLGAPVGSLRATVLKVPHHGSGLSSSAVFLERVRPSVAVVSAGRSNRFGFPHDDALQRLERSGAVVYRTDRAGAVRVLTDGRFLKVTGMLGESCRTWQAGH